MAQMRHLNGISELALNLLIIESQVNKYYIAGIVGSKTRWENLAMALYGLLSAPIAGMMAQTSAFGAISDNITNMRTGGYKSTEVRFKTALATTFSITQMLGE